MGFWRSNTGNLVYRLESKETINDVSYNMLKNGALSSMLGVTRVSDDDKRELRYATDGYEVLGPYLRSHIFTKSHYARILLNVIAAYSELDDCLMSADGMAASLDLMYVNPRLELGMVYLPIDDVKINFGLKDMLLKVDSEIEIKNSEDMSKIVVIRKAIKTGSPDTAQLKRSLTELLATQNKEPDKVSTTSSQVGGGYVAPQPQHQISVGPQLSSSSDDDVDSKKGFFGLIKKAKKTKTVDTAVGNSVEEQPKKSGLFGGLFKDKEKGSEGKSSKKKDEAVPAGSFSGFAIPGQASSAAGGAEIGFTPGVDSAADKNGSRISAEYTDDDFGRTMVAGFDPVAVKPSASNGKTQAALLRLDSGVRYEIDTSPFIVGRHTQNTNLCIKDHKQVSREHATITHESTGFYIEDMGARNYTFVNGKKLAAHQKVPISSGDQITFADCDFKFLIS